MLRNAADGKMSGLFHENFIIVEGFEMSFLVARPCRIDSFFSEDLTSFFFEKPLKVPRVRYKFINKNRKCRKNLLH